MENWLTEWKIFQFPGGRTDGDGMREGCGNVAEVVSKHFFPYFRHLKNFLV